MALNVNTNLAVESSANVFATPNNGIVGDSELTNVAKQILSATPGRSSVLQGALSRANPNNNIDVKFFEAGYDLNAVKQTATNRIGLDVTLSQNALNSINALKAQAAQNQTRNPTRTVNGKIHINIEKPENAELKAAISKFNPDMEVFQTANTDKDRKGPGGFYIPQQNGEQDKEEGLNIVI